MTIEYEIRQVWAWHEGSGRAPEPVYRVYDVTAGRMARVAEFEDRPSAVEWVRSREES